MTDETLVTDQPAEMIEQAETVEEVVSQESAPDETTGEEAPEDTSAKPKKSGVQKRIDELVKEREELRRDAQFWAEQARSKESGEGKPQAEPKSQEIVEPKADDFDSYEQYIDALTDYKTDQKLRGYEVKQAEKQKENRQKQADELQQRKIQERMNQGREKYQDFDEVARNPSVPITQEMALSIGDSDVGGDLAYYLGSNPDEAANIARMSPASQLRALGRIEAKLESQPANEVQASKAPSPVRPVSKGAQANVDPNKMSIDEWMDWRRKQVNG